MRKIIPLFSILCAIFLSATANGFAKNRSIHSLSGPVGLPHLAAVAANTLAGLTLSKGTLSPAFLPGTFAYAATVASAVSSITVTPVAADTSAIISVNGITVLSGKVSKALLLTAGQNTITIVVTPKGTLKANTYILTITRLPITDADLSNLNISPGKLDQVFSSNNLAYTASAVVDKKDHTVFSLGDSITERNLFEPTLDSLLNNVFRFINYGFGGATAADLVGMYPAIAKAAPDYVIILAGTNDLRSGFNAVPVENSLQALYTAAHNSGTKVIALTITPFKGTSSWSAAKQATQDSVNTWMTKSAIADYVVDTYKALVDPANANQMLPAYDSGDHLHPNTTGGSIMAHLIYGAVKFTPNPAIDQSNAANNSVAVTPVLADAYAHVTVNGNAVASGSASAAIPLVTGANKITTIVTAADGVTKKTYGLTLTGKSSANASLANMYMSLNTGIMINPSFFPDSVHYAATVIDADSALTVAPTASNTGAKITVNGSPVLSGHTSQGVKLVLGTNKITTVVTAADGITTKTYTAIITDILSPDADLLKLIPGSGYITPVFSPDTISYASTVVNSVASITLTPMASNTKSTIKVNGQIVPSGISSASIPLQLGANTLTTVVTAQDGKSTKTYTLTITRSLSTDASLSNLTISPGAIKPAFTTANGIYNVSVGNVTTSVTITPTTTDPNATVQVAAKPVNSGTASAPIPLIVGDNVIATIITAQNGLTTRNYKITVTRAPSSNAKLLSLTTTSGVVSPAFNNTVTGYTRTVPNSTTSISFTPTTVDAGATITINGTVARSGKISIGQPLAIDDNTETIKVTAQDGVTAMTYTVIVTRAPSSNAKLLSLTTTSGVVSPAFNNTVTNYTRAVPNSTTSISFTPTTVDAGASITINGTVARSGKISIGQPLAVGNNTETIKVTAQDGVTTMTYTVIVTRAAAALNTVYQPLSVTNPENKLNLNDDVILVHQGVSPNGDGINDFLQIDGILAYPDNKLQIMNRSGQLIFEAKNYNNSTKVFDGHSNKTGALQLSGTYFYSLDYTVKGEIKHKTGFIVLKY